MTQEELAKKAGIKRDRYAKYETGATPVPSDLVVIFSIIFGVSTDYLLGLSDDPKLNQVTDPALLKELEETRKIIEDAFVRFASIMEKHMAKQENSPN